MNILLFNILQNERKGKKGVDSGIKWADNNEQKIHIEQKVASNLRILCMVNEIESDQRGRV